MSIKILNLRPMQGGACVALFEVQLKNSMIITGMGLYMKDGKTWANMPARSYQNAEGKTCYVPYVCFADKANTKAFCDLASKTAVEYAQQNGIPLGAGLKPQPQSAPEEESNDGLPF